MLLGLATKTVSTTLLINIKENVGISLPCGKLYNTRSHKF